MNLNDFRFGMQEAGGNCVPNARPFPVPSPDWPSFCNPGHVWLLGTPKVCPSCLACHETLELTYFLGFAKPFIFGKWPLNSFHFHASAGMAHTTVP